MGAGERGRSRRYLRALTRIQKFLGANGQGPYPAEEIRRLAPDLRLLYEKYRKIRSMCGPQVRFDLSPAVWALLIEAGIANREIQPLRRAGSA